MDSSNIPRVALTGIYIPFQLQLALLQTHANIGNYRITAKWILSQFHELNKWI